MPMPLHPSSVLSCCSRCSRQTRRTPSIVTVDSIERFARGMALHFIFQNREPDKPAFCRTNELGLRQSGGPIANRLLPRLLGCGRCLSSVGLGILAAETLHAPCGIDQP